MRILLIGKTFATAAFAQYFTQNPNNIVFSTLSGTDAESVDILPDNIQELKEFALANEMSLTLLCDKDSILSPIKEEFEKEIKQNNFLEWAQYSGNYYGTRKDFVLNSLNKGVDVLLEIEVQGAKKVMEQYPYCVSIFITPPNMEELEKRLRGRKTECEEAILKRLEVVKSELSEAKNYKYTIVNDKVDKAFKELDEIYQKERML